METPSGAGAGLGAEGSIRPRHLVYVGLLDLGDRWEARLGECRRRGHLRMDYGPEWGEYCFRCHWRLGRVEWRALGWVPGWGSVWTLIGWVWIEELALWSWVRATWLTWQASWTRARSCE